jgi:hypothetical protein
MNFAWKGFFWQPLKGSNSCKAYNFRIKVGTVQWSTSLEYLFKDDINTVLLRNQAIWLGKHFQTFYVYVPYKICTYSNGDKTDIRICYWIKTDNKANATDRILYFEITGFRVMVFDATFSNISVISWRSVLLVKETGVPGEKHRPAASHWQTLSHNVVSFTPHHELDSNSQL